MPQPASAPPPIVVDGVSKTFRIPEERVHTLKERALHPLRRSRHETFAALHDISFAIRRGEFFGSTRTSEPANLRIRRTAVAYLSARSCVSVSQSARMIDIF